MIRISELVLNFLFNAAWQIVAVALIAWISGSLLRNAAARYRHALWVAALVASVALPFWSLTASAPKADKEVESSPISALRVSDHSIPVRPATIAPLVSVRKESSPAMGALLTTRRQPLVTPPTLLVALALTYALFVLYRSSRLWHLWRRTQSLRGTTYQREIPASMKAVAAKCRAALRLKSVPLVCSAIASTPFTLGGSKPLVILPEDFYRELPEDTLFSVLGHEMAHIARRDYLLNLLYEFLLLPISFHPLAKLIKRQIDRTRELACDEIVTERLLDSEAHARSLIRVAGGLVGSADQAFMLGIFDANILEERIMQLTRNTRRCGLGAGRLLALTAISLLCVSSLAISTFCFELRSNGGNAAVDASTLQEVLLASSDKVVLPTQTANRTQERHSGRVPARAENELAPPSSNPSERALTACEAGRQRAVDAIPMLVSMLGDDSEIEPLKCWTAGNWSPALATFKHPSPGEQAAIALASMGRPAFAALSEGLGSANSSVRRNAAWAIGELTNMPPGERQDAVMPLISLLGDSDQWVRIAAARALGELRDERAGESLIAALGDSEVGVRQTSAWALGEMKDERAVETLCYVLVSDMQSGARLAAAEALGEIRSQKALAPLNQALNDLEPSVRARATWAISEIEDNDG